MILHSRKKPGENQTSLATIQEHWGLRVQVVCRPWDSLHLRRPALGLLPRCLEPPLNSPRKEATKPQGHQRFPRYPPRILKIFRKQGKNEGRKERPAYVLSEHLELRAQQHLMKEAAQAASHNFLPVPPSPRPSPLMLSTPVLRPHARGGEAQVAITLHWPGQGLHQAAPLFSAARPMGSDSPCYC